MTDLINDLRKVALSNAWNDVKRSKTGWDINPFSTQGARALWQAGFDGTKPYLNVVETSIDWTYVERGRLAKDVLQREQDGRRHLLAIVQTPRDCVYEIVYDHADPKQAGGGGIIRNGEDYAGFHAKDGSVYDYDAVFELRLWALRSLEAAGFKVEEVR